MVTAGIFTDNKLTGNQATCSIGRINQTAGRNSLSLSQDSFGRMMDMTVQNTATSQKRNEMQLNSTQNDKSMTLTDTDNIVRRQSKVEYIVKSASHTGNGQAVDEAVMSDSLKTFSTDLKAVVCQVLDLTDEELERLLADNGMCISDLLMFNNLALFVADALTEGDTVKLLTDNDISQLYGELGDRISSLIAKTCDGMNITKDELVSFLMEYDIQQNERAESDTDAMFAEAGNIPVEEKNFSEVGQVYAELEYNRDEETSVQSVSGHRSGEAVFEADTQVPTTELLEDKIELHSDSRDNASAGQEGESFTGQLLETLVKNVENSLNSDNVVHGQAVDAEDVVRQLTDYIRVNLNSRTSEMELQLSPESLGKINLLVESKNGVITAQLTTQNEAVKAIIENQLVSLKENFIQQGLKVEAVEVMVESHGFETGRNLEGRTKDNSREEHKSSRQLSLEEIDARLAGQDDVSEEELLAAEMMRATGGSVDYTA